MPANILNNHVGGTSEFPGTPRPTLESGDHLTRAEFERRYRQRPDIKKAELIDGVVYVMTSPVRISMHAAPHSRLITWLGTYQAATPGVEVADNATVRLDMDNEPQPDALLRILPECGGQSRTDKDDYVTDAPELIAEIAASSASYDMHSKLHAYRRNAVQEYLVVLVEEGVVKWFRMRGGEYQQFEPDSDGTIRSEIFAGLWLNVPAFLGGDMARMLDVLREGLATEGHTAFRAKLRLPKAGA